MIQERISDGKRKQAQVVTIHNSTSIQAEAEADTVDVSNNERNQLRNALYQLWDVKAIVLCHTINNLAQRNEEKNLDRKLQKQLGYNELPKDANYKYFKKVFGTDKHLDGAIKQYVARKCRAASTDGVDDSIEKIKSLILSMEKSILSMEDLLLKKTLAKSKSEIKKINRLNAEISRVLDNPKVSLNKVNALKLQVQKKKKSFAACQTKDDFYNKHKITYSWVKLEEFKKKQKDFKEKQQCLERNNEEKSNWQVKESNNHFTNMVDKIRAKVFANTDPEKILLECRDEQIKTECYHMLLAFILDKETLSQHDNLEELFGKYRSKVSRCEALELDLEIKAIQLALRGNNQIDEDVLTSLQGKYGRLDSSKRRLSTDELEGLMRSVKLHNSLVRRIEQFGIQQEKLNGLITQSNQASILADSNFTSQIDEVRIQVNAILEAEAHQSAIDTYDNTADHLHRDERQIYRKLVDDCITLKLKSVKSISQSANVHYNSVRKKYVTDIEIDTLEGLLGDLGFLHSLTQQNIKGLSATHPDPLELYRDKRQRSDVSAHSQEFASLDKALSELSDIIGETRRYVTEKVADCRKFFLKFFESDRKILDCIYRRIVAIRKDDVGDKIFTDGGEIKTFFSQDKQTIGCRINESEIEDALLLTRQFQQHHQSLNQKSFFAEVAINRVLLERLDESITRIEKNTWFYSIIPCKPLQKELTDICNVIEEIQRLHQALQNEKEEYIFLENFKRLKSAYDVMHNNIELFQKKESLMTGHWYVRGCQVVYWFVRAYVSLVNLSGSSLDPNNYRPPCEQIKPALSLFCCEKEKNEVVFSNCRKVCV